jgi:hypothetical protein
MRARSLLARLDRAECWPTARFDAESLFDLLRPHVEQAPSLRSYRPDVPASSRGSRGARLDRISAAFSELLCFRAALVSALPWSTSSGRLMPTPVVAA